MAALRELKDDCICLELTSQCKVKFVEKASDKVLSNVLGIIGSIL